MRSGAKVISKQASTPSSTRVFRSRLHQNLRRLWRKRNAISQKAAAQNALTDPFLRIAVRKRNQDARAQYPRKGALPLITFSPKQSSTPPRTRKDRHGSVLPRTASPDSPARPQTLASSEITYTNTYDEFGAARNAISHADVV